ncbi:MAG: hypothetical protein Q8S20_05150 [Sulfuritalea sp.]|nr:hypothetical protein [Sulfuritalea sp.]
MSPSPTSRAGLGLAIGLCPDAVGIVRLGGWRHARVDGHELVAVGEPGTDGLAALAALENWLQQNRPAASGLRPWFSAPAHVVLSDRLVRYARVPWSGGALSRQEEDELSVACFEERYGDMSGWTLRNDVSRYGQGRLATAVPSALMDGLRRVLKAHRLDCRAVSPYFVVCWNLWRRDVARANGKAAAMFAVADAGTAVVGVVDATGWRSLRSLRMGTEDLLPTLARETVLNGLSEPPATWVHCPQPGEFGTPSGNFKILSTPNSLPAPVAMAMSGIGR